MISFKHFSLCMMLGSCLAMSILMGGLAWSELPQMKDALPPTSRNHVNTDLQELMGWMKSLNLSQSAKQTDQSFERFFDLKSQGDAPVHMLEKAAAFKQSAHRNAAIKSGAPKSTHHRSF